MSSLKRLVICAVLFATAACGSGGPDIPAVATPPPGGPQGEAIGTLEMWAEFTTPVAIRAPEGDEAWYIVEKPGRVWRYDGTDRELIIDIVDDVSEEAEEGLFDFIVAPDGEHAYVHFTGNEQPYGDNHIREYGWNGRTVTDEGREVLVVEHPYPHHNGGQLQFGPDGYLYIAIGDGGTETLTQEENNGDPHRYGKTKDELLGNILRIDPSTPSGDKGYTVPPDNPFVNETGADEIWAYGLRNPWRFSFDMRTGDLWIPDVGHRFWEEINYQKARSKGGQNYGWSYIEGIVPYKGEAPKGLTYPVYAYPHRDGQCAIMGGYVYRGRAFPELRGWYVYADFCSGDLQAIRLRNGKVAGQVSLGVKAKTPLVSLGQDRDGEIFAITYRSGVYRLVPKD